MPFRIGSVPYLNAKPLVDWFHSDTCTVQAQVTYDVPSRLARMLREDAVDVANVSIFEAFQNPELALVPGIAIAAFGPVKSVRLFSKVPLDRVRSVALDTSSLTSAALTRILLKEQFGVTPCYVHHPPDLATMLRTCDAGLIIGDLKLFALIPEIQVYDLGQGWLDLTGLPFVYAAWLARRDRISPDLIAALEQARAWGMERREQLAQKWARIMDLPLDRCRDYLLHVMHYELGPEYREGLQLFQRKCYEHGLIHTLLPLSG
ncbi:MAG: menaquinone biosynthesis protein [Chloroherpetonaceae bacterium]|nr:menaquinone biosynthesis protein [Chthonomonadaceae bacterium]MDW8208171.1 menaquinone biosynthesis protein [Chloroherpetonaceae bacterium]